MFNNKKVNISVIQNINETQSTQTLCFPLHKQRSIKTHKHRLSLSIWSLFLDEARQHTPHTALLASSIQTQYWHLLACTLGTQQSATVTTAVITKHHSMYACICHIALTSDVFWLKC